MHLLDVHSVAKVQLYNFVTSSYFLCTVDRCAELVVSGWFHGLPSDACSCNTSLGLCLVTWCSYYCPRVHLVLHTGELFNTLVDTLTQGFSISKPGTTLDGKSNSKKKKKDK